MCGRTSESVTGVVTSTDQATLFVTTEVTNDGRRRRCQAACTRRCSIPPARLWRPRCPTQRHRLQPRRPRLFRMHAMRRHPASCGRCETPNLYRAVTTLEVDGKIVDRGCQRRSGFARCEFDADKGFLLNGKPVKIKGTCNHQDHAGVGAAIPDRIQEYRLERLKWMGSNGCSTSHNPPTPEFLDACDRMGMLVMDETRMMSSNPEGHERAGAADQARPQPSERHHLVAGATRSRSRATRAARGLCTR